MVFMVVVVVVAVAGGARDDDDVGADVMLAGIPEGRHTLLFPSHSHAPKSCLHLPFLITPEQVTAAGVGAGVVPDVGAGVGAGSSVDSARSSQNAGFDVQPQPTTSPADLEVFSILLQAVIISGSPL